MTEYSENLFKKIILLFIENFNPPDKLLDSNYVTSYLLIKIFKFLCEEHNNFFQCRLIKSLKYKYIEITPIFCEETSKESESISSWASILFSNAFALSCLSISHSLRNSDKSILDVSLFPHAAKRRADKPINKIILIVPILQMLFLFR